MQASKVESFCRWIFSKKKQFSGWKGLGKDAGEKYDSQIVHRIGDRRSKAWNSQERNSFCIDRLHECKWLNIFKKLINYCRHITCRGNWSNRLSLSAREKPIIRWSSQMCTKRDSWRQSKRYSNEAENNVNSTYIISIWLQYVII